VLAGLVIQDHVIVCRRKEPRCWQISLDFSSVRSSTGPGKQRVTLMNTAAINESIKICLGEVRTKLDEATRLARAAEACVAAGRVAKGIDVSMGIEQLIYEAGRL
jgi:hypothetical protein